MILKIAGLVFLMGSLTTCCPYHYKPSYHVEYFPEFQRMNRNFVQGAEANMQAYIRHVEEQLPMESK